MGIMSEINWALVEILPLLERSLILLLAFSLFPIDCSILLKIHVVHDSYLFLFRSHRKGGRSVKDFYLVQNDYLKDDHT